MSILIGMSFPTQGGAEFAVSVIAGFFITILLRLPSFFIERYLMQRHAKRHAILTPHLVAAAFATFIALGEIETSTTTSTNIDDDSPSGLATVIATYLLFSLVGLGVSAIMRLLRSRRERMRYNYQDATQTNQQQRRATLTLNIILVVCTSMIIAPSFAAQENKSLIYGFFGGLLVSAILRTPGAFAEKYVLKYGTRRSVYITHSVVSILTVFTILTNYLDPIEGSPYEAGIASADATGSIVGIYLFLSSLAFGFATAVIALRRWWKRHSVHRNGVTPSDAMSQPQGALIQETKPAGWNTERVMAPEVSSSHTVPERPSTVSHPIELPDRAAPVKQPVPQTLTSEISKSQHKMPGKRSPLVKSTRNDVALVVGMVTGLSSVVQGFLEEDPYKAVISLTIGTLGVVAIYNVFSSTHDSRSDRTG